MTTATTGTGTITLGSAVSGYRTFAGSGVNDGDIVAYGIIDGANSEAGTGTYTASGTTLTRNVRQSTNSNTAISLSGNAQVFITACAEDLIAAPLNPGGRLTLTSSVPVMIATVASPTTLYYTPYKGSYVPLWDGKTWNHYQFSELSQLFTDTTKSPAAVAASKNYDVFVWNDAGTLRCTRGPAWTSDTARGYSLTLQDGMYLNAGNITNGPAANRGLLVGTVRSDSGSKVVWNTGGNATAGALGVWNMFNRVIATAGVVDNGVTYNYTTANVIRQWRASSNYQVNFILGASEDSYSVFAQVTVGLATVPGGTGVTIFIGLNSTSVASSRGSAVAGQYTSGNAPVQSTMLVAGGMPVAIGWNFIAALERNSTTDANTYNYGQDNALSVAIPM